MFFMLDMKKSIAIAVAVQAAVIAVTLWLYGVTDGAELATRNTARGAAVFFAWALALRSRSGEGPRAMFGFVAAHAMHFASVAYFSAISVKAPLHQLNARSVVSVTAGLTLLGALGFTIGAQRAWQRRINIVAAFLFGFVFTFSTIFNGLGLRRAPAWGSVVPLPFLLIAMYLHFRNISRPQTTRTATAS